jgi:hypothetical protein
MYVCAKNPLHKFAHLTSDCFCTEPGCDGVGYLIQIKSPTDLIPPVIAAGHVSVRQPLRLAPVAPPHTSAGSGSSSATSSPSGAGRRPTDHSWRTQALPIIRIAIRAGHGLLQVLGALASDLARLIASALTLLFRNWRVLLLLTGIALGLVWGGPPALRYYLAITRPVRTWLLKREVAAAITGWAQATYERNLESSMGYFADQVQPYYSLKSATAANVRTDLARKFSNYSILRIQITNLDIAPDPSGRSASATFDMASLFRGQSAYSPSVRERLSLQKISGMWRITGIEDLGTYPASTRDSSNSNRPPRKSAPSPNATPHNPVPDQGDRTKTEVESHISQAKVLLDPQRRYQDAINECDAALKLDPGNEEALALRAKIKDINKIVDNQ